MVLSTELGRRDNCSRDGGVNSLASLSAACFRTLRHALYPSHSIRIKKASEAFCHETSRTDPHRDDVVFWTNGGPRCSSSTWSPCRVLDAYGPKYLFIVDQPVGVGFLYGETVSTTEEAGWDIVAQFEGRALHMAGESYGGRFLPLFALAIYNNNALLLSRDRPLINPKSLMIANGLTDSITMVLSYFDMECTWTSVPPIVNISTCVTIKSTKCRCERWMQDACINVLDPINCGAAYSLCSAVIGTPYARTRRISGMNPCDMSRCHPMRKYISEYVSVPSVRSLLGVDMEVAENFSSCKNDIIHHVAAVLEWGGASRWLIYVGANDWLCNWVGNERWTFGLAWSGQRQFVKERLREWVVDGKVVEKTRSARGLTFALDDGGLRPRV
ncbi:alpha/beta-hydrolase [Guyanagaster necrorhizus]|uniref:Carboxypeptidase n=1 Tax=Guyanagaster necrorhizus TaxID=856835 RepID=A0A9P8ANF6_9AGAR|nr:alpha/beta-hydrolase [Guyanagaster necrorhizus MCA 3950]KAG7441784.1 alpha/beta-hydrolase [Guyanagaster necrorhizus MCA 3950]